MERLVNGEGGESKGLKKAIDRAEEVLPRLEQAAERYQVAGEALLEFARDQDGAIEAADRAILEYEQAREDAATAANEDVPEDGADAHESRMDELRGNVAAAEAAYNAARDDWNRAAEHADSLIEDVVEDSPLNDGMFDDIKGLGEDILDALAPVADLLAEIAKSLSALENVLIDLVNPWGDENPSAASDAARREAVEKFRDPGPAGQAYRKHVDEMFDLADASYNDSGAPKPWHRLTGAELAAYGIDMATDKNFQASVFRNPETGEVAVAYRGSEMNAGDWSQNLQNAGDLSSAQHEQAIDLATQVTDTFGIDNVEFTGHSLGGSLAATASVATGCNATTFNAEGIGAGNYAAAADAYGDRASADNVTNFRTSNDPLTIGQEGIDVVPPAGVQVTIPTETPGIAAGHGRGPSHGTAATRRTDENVGNGRAAAARLRARGGVDAMPSRRRPACGQTSRRTSRFGSCR
ncbi:Mbeg1-like protein [Nocardioides albertanoniae]|nr:Mbeg1-like protein [Nocardioides albertanoniae]